MNAIQAGLSRHYKRLAERRRCPECQRKAALSFGFREEDGKIYKTCRYCGSKVPSLYVGFKWP